MRRPRRQASTPSSDTAGSPRECTVALGNRSITRSLSLRVAIAGYATAILRFISCKLSLIDSSHPAGPVIADGGARMIGVGYISEGLSSRQ